MRQLSSWIVVGGLAALVLGCAPKPEPAGSVAAEEVTEESPVKAPSGEPLNAENGDFETGGLEGWDEGDEDPSRTDFETGDASGWTGAEGLKESDPPKEDNQR